MLIASAVLLHITTTRPALPLETNMLALLPAASHDPTVARATARANDALSRQHIILVGAGSPQEAIAIAEPLAITLRDSGAFAAVHARIDTRQGDALGRFYAPYRNGLMSHALQQRVAAQGTRALTQHAMETLFSPASAVNSALLANDPLLLYYDFLLSLANTQGRVHIEQGYPFMHYRQQAYVLLRVELADSPFALSTQQRSLPVLDAALAAAHARAPGADILDTGVLRFAAAGVQSAQHEVSTIGAGSLLGIVLLFLWVFRAITPLLLTLLPIACGFAVALAACLQVFGQVHLMTLVFGASLIGLSVDYSLHFLIDRQASDAQWQPADSLRRIGRGLMLGLATSVTAFMALSLTPFPGMQQMAVFCSAGLIAAALTVTGLFPVILHHGQPGTAPGLGFAARWLGLWKHHPWRLGSGLLALAALAIPGLQQLHTNDDIRLLQGKPPALMATDARIRDITGQADGNRFLLVEGDSAEQALQRTEAASAVLEAQRVAGTLDNFDSIGHWLPSLARQQATSRTLAGLPEDPVAQAYAAGIGLDATLLDTYATPAPPLLPEAWLNDPVSLPWRVLWLDDAGHGYATIMPVRGASDIAAIQHAIRAIDGVRWVDPVSNISALLKAYRERASIVVMAAFAAIALLLVLRYRPRRALTAIAPAVLAATGALAITGWLGEPVTVFHLLALLLVLGFGLDYSLFLLENPEHPQPAMLAILCSGATTVLSFGLLALSDTPAIHAFGIIVLSGITITLVFAPLAQPVHNEVSS
ncbi:MAG TPA: MMPL family transporter [Pseudomonadales bacterium]